MAKGHLTQPKILKPSFVTAERQPALRADDTERQAGALTAPRLAFGVSVMRAVAWLCLAVSVAGCSATTDRGSPVTEMRRPVRTKVVVKVVERPLERTVFVKQSCPVSAPCPSCTIPSTPGVGVCADVPVSMTEFNRCRAHPKIDDCHIASGCSWLPSITVNGTIERQATCLPNKLIELVKGHT